MDAADITMRADANRNRQLLLSTARTLFATYGVQAVTMSQLAQYASVGKGTLYRHFSSKTEVCYALIDQVQAPFREEALARSSGTDQPYSVLCWFLQAACQFVLHNTDLLMGCFHQAKVEALTFAPTRWWRNLIYDLLQQINPDSDANYNADILFIMLNVCTIQYQQSTRGLSEQQIFVSLVQTLDALVGYQQCPRHP